MQEAVGFFLVTCWEKDPESSGRAESCELGFFGEMLRLSFREELLLSTQTA